MPLNFSLIDRQDIRWLLSEKYHWPIEKIAEFLQHSTSPDLTPEIEKDFERLAAGEPIDYVIGWKKFLRCHIDLSLKPLIPRPETEFWVEKMIKELKPSETVKDFKVLDLCCGSGCIGIALLKYWPMAYVEFADISETALKQTELNLKFNENERGSSRFTLTHSDLFSSVKNTLYDFIVCNPPYVNPSGEFAVGLKWEPSNALFAQKEGFALIEKVISELKTHLEKRGHFVLEFEKGQEGRVEGALKKAGFSKYSFGTDQYGIVRFVVGESS
jgi:release factor glutamine methyltransferase